MAVGDLGADVVHVVKRVLDGRGAQHALRDGEVRTIDARVALCVYVKLWALGTRLWAVVGGLGEGVAHMVKRAIDGQGAQHALREGEMRAIDDRAVLCVC